MCRLSHICKNGTLKTSYTSRQQVQLPTSGSFSYAISMQFGNCTQTDHFDMKLHLQDRSPKPLYKAF